MTDYAETMLEEMDRKFDFVVEMVLSMKEEMSGLATKADLEEVKTDIRIIKHAVADLSKQVTKHINDRTIHLPRKATAHR